MPDIGDVVADKYRIDTLVGEGGMGAVFAASHALTGKRVALKWLRPELAANEAAVRRFMREAQAAGRIDHPNVVDIYDVGQHQGSTFLVMEFLFGEPLSARIDRGPIEVDEALALLLPAMRGVAEAHSMGVVHRDLKPDNIFLCRGPDGAPREPKVLDFGISKVSSGDGVNLRLTRTGAVMGTPYYMSPEQIRDSAEIDQRTDVYALGVILYETLTGRVPFDGESYSSLVLQIATGTPLPIRQILPGLPAGLERVVQRAMAREQADRFADVSSLVRALEPYASVAGFTTERRDPTGPRRTFESTTPFVSEGPPTTPMQRSALLWVFGGAAVLVMAVLIGLYLTRPEPTPTAAGPAAPELPASPPSTPAPSVAPAPATVPKLPSGGAPSAALSAGSGGGPALALPPSEAAPSAAAPAAAPAAATGTSAAAPEHVRSRRPSAQPAGPVTPASTAPAPVQRPNSRTGGLRADEF
jgi:serine/threonine protein kinase